MLNTAAETVALAKETIYLHIMALVVPVALRGHMVLVVMAETLLHQPLHQTLAGAVAALELLVRLVVGVLDSFHLVLTLQVAVLVVTAVVLRRASLGALVYMLILGQMVLMAAEVRAAGLMAPED